MAVSTIGVIEQDIFEADTNSQEDYSSAENSMFHIYFFLNNFNLHTHKLTVVLRIIKCDLPKMFELTF